MLVGGALAWGASEYRVKTGRGAGPVLCCGGGGGDNNTNDKSRGRVPQCLNAQRPTNVNCNIYHHTDAQKKSMCTIYIKG